MIFKLFFNNIINIPRFVFLKKGVCKSIVMETTSMVPSKVYRYRLSKHVQNSQVIHIKLYTTLIYV